MMTDTTAKAMRLKFPALAAQSDAAIDFALEEARRQVDQTWTPGDQLRGLMWLAAHYLALGQAMAESGTGQLLASETITGLGSQTYAGVAPYDACNYYLTVYGRMYLDILKLNQGSPLVI